MSLGRGANAIDWLEVKRLRITDSWIRIGQLDVCESRALLAQAIETCRLRVFEVNAQHGLRSVCTVETEIPFWRFTCSRIGPDTLVAFAHQTAVSLHRLAARRLEPLDRFELGDPYNLLFRGDLLLVTNRNNETDPDAIVPLLATEGHLMLLPLLLDAMDSVCIDEWCLVGDHLVVVEDRSKDMLEYAFE